MSEPISDEALWDFAESLAAAWGVNDDDPRWIAEDFRDRFVARFGHGSQKSGPSDAQAEAALAAFAHRDGALANREDMIAALKAAAEGWDEGRWAQQKPQGEPSDAQVDAMQEILYDDYREGDRDVIRRAWRAALRAAGGAR